MQKACHPRSRQRGRGGTATAALVLAVSSRPCLLVWGIGDGPDDDLPPQPDPIGGRACSNSLLVEPYTEVVMARRGERRPRQRQRRQSSRRQHDAGCCRLAYRREEPRSGHAVLGKKGPRLSGNRLRGTVGDRYLYPIWSFDVELAWRGPTAEIDRDLEPEGSGTSSVESRTTCTLPASGAPSDSTHCRRLGS